MLIKTLLSNLWETVVIVLTLIITFFAALLLAVFFISSFFIGNLTERLWLIWVQKGIKNVN